VIDEAFVNKVRASILMQEYIKSGQILTKHAANDAEKFWLPNFLNPQHEKWITYGKKCLHEKLNDSTVSD